MCWLIDEGAAEGAEARLTALVQSTDGFELAEVDLDLRGEGTIMGERQKGRSDLRLASLRRDREMVGLAREVAFELVDTDGGITSLPGLADELRLFVGDEEADFLLKGWRQAQARTASSFFSTASSLVFSEKLSSETSTRQRVHQHRLLATRQPAVAIAQRKVPHDFGHLVHVAGLQLLEMVLEPARPVRWHAHVFLREHVEDVFDFVLADRGSDADLFGLLDRHHQGEITVGDPQHQVLDLLAEHLALLFALDDGRPVMGIHHAVSDLETHSFNPPQLAARSSRMPDPTPFPPFTPSRHRSLVCVVRHNEIPSIATVAAAIGDEVTRVPHTILGRVRDEVRATSAVDACDDFIDVHRSPPVAIGELRDTSREPGIEDHRVAVHRLVRKRRVEIETDALVDREPIVNDGGPRRRRDLLGDLDRGVERAARRHRRG